MLFCGAGKIQGNDFREISLARFALVVVTLRLVCIVASAFDFDIFPNVCCCVVRPSIYEHGFQHY